jgi:hypothetical protein
MFSFFIGCNAQGLRGSGVARSERLSLIKSLSANLSTMVYAHQAHDVTPLPVVQYNLLTIYAGSYANAARRRQKGSENKVNFENNLIDRH